MNLITFIGKTADEMGFSAFVVGGFVRDLLLGVENYDIDIVIEGNAIEFAERLTKKLCGSYVYHKRFGTAAVFFPCPKGFFPGKIKASHFKIDVAMTRTEIYERPAALPTVKFGPIENDLYRRDFTINAMAFKLDRHGFGELLDPFNGRKDLKEGKIRALHDLSFVDDPTRIFRAVRFEQRFDFKIEPHTEDLIKKAIGLKMVDRTQKQRIREEMIAILSEEESLKAVKRLSELNELRFIDPRLKLKETTKRLFNAVDETLSWYDRMELKKGHTPERWLIYFMALLDELDLSEVRRICADFVFTKADSAKALSYKKDSDKALLFLSRKGKLEPSQIYVCLKGLSDEVLILLIARTRSQAARRRIVSYLTKYANVRLSVKGDDLIKRGLKPGPHFRVIMEKTLHAKIDKVVRTGQEELAFALSRLKK